MMVAKNLRNFFIITGIFFVATLLAITLHAIFSVECHNLTPPQKNQKTVILVCSLPGNGGAEQSTAIHQRELLKEGLNTVLIAKKNEFLATHSIQNKLPVITYSSFRISFGRVVFMPGLKQAIKQAINLYKKNILVIHCAQNREVFVAKNALQEEKIPLVVTQHNINTPSKALRNACDGIVAVNKEMAKTIESKNCADQLKNKIAVALPPFFNDKLFINFKPTCDKKTFFKKYFNIELLDAPIISKIAFMYSNMEHKNHPLLFYAMHELIYKKNIDIQAVLVGNGPNLKKLKLIAKKLKLEKYLHFLGSVSNPLLIAEILYHSNINMLASSKEAFGIVIMEGGMLKKPTITARLGCGASDWLIIDNETGFLFENKNANDLADKIHCTLKHKNEAKICGENLYKKIQAEFSSAQTTKAMLKLYNQLNEQKYSLHESPD